MYEIIDVLMSFKNTDRYISLVKAKNDYGKQVGYTLGVKPLNKETVIGMKVDGSVFHPIKSYEPFIRLLSPIDFNTLVEITTSLEGNVITTDNKTFLVYKNTLSMKDGYLFYNTGCKQQPEIEKFEMLKKDNLKVVCGCNSTLILYELKDDIELL